ncbi:hypothetical protein I7I51_01519 [Histoplasma capsulatum]|uniref:Uncharacterized protein n=1 Tax=Ajellomyces capsulatus TaxID=5037 RepID=A0A8A1MEV0_AJECA|nr:hypothetical protein I7I51_01519 [Histoplasma capsulatum]
MTLIPSTPDDAPPPYTPIDPLNPASSNESSITVGAAAEQPLVDNDARIPPYNNFASIPNFISGAPYFRVRPVSHAEPQELLQHTLTIYPRSQPKDYHRFPKCLRPRGVEIMQHDWDTFLNYLFPPHLAPAASQSHLPRKLRAEIQRDRKDCAQEGDDERQVRIEAVLAEWNNYFFLPRSTEILYTYVSPSGPQPSTHLCPKCYPSTVRSLPVRSGPHPVRSATTPSCSRARSVPRRPVGNNPSCNSALAPEVSTVNAQGSTTIPPPIENPSSSRAGGYEYATRLLHMESWSRNEANSTAG